MPRLRLLPLLAALLLLTLGAAPALAHQGNPNYRSIISSFPKVKGLSLTVVNYDDSLSLENTSGKLVTVDDYDGSPYVRFLPNGTVEQNLNSPATYINNDRTGTGTVPPNAHAGATPNWKVLDKSGRYIWHDHRIHYMGAGLPPAVKDKGVRTRVDDWRIPMSVGSAPAMIQGHLDWVGQSDASAPVGAFVAGGLILLLGGAAVVIVRRRRREDDALGATSGAPTVEAW